MLVKKNVGIEVDGTFRVATKQLPPDVADVTWFRPMTKEIFHFGDVSMSGNWSKLSLMAIMLIIKSTNRGIHLFVQEITRSMLL